MLKKISIISMVWIGFILVAPLAQSQTSSNVAAIQNSIKRYLKQKGFSGTILVAEKGTPIYHQSFGLAQRKPSDKLQNDYHYGVASVTKLFTSIRILQLIEDKKIALSKSITTYLPQWKSQISPKVSIHHLLLHISGLPNIKDEVYLKPWTPTQVVQRSLNNRPKTKIGKFNYNNMDYILLGLLIEQVTGNRWETEITQHILKPFRLQNTGFLKYKNYSAKFAYPYSYQGKAKANKDPLFHIENFFSAGNMYSTAEDLLRLDQALYGDRLLKPASKKLLSKSYPRYGYAGYGVWNYAYPFIAQKPQIMERRGGIQGANVVLVRLIEANKTIIILSNDDRFNPDSFGDKTNLREMLIKALFAPSPLVGTWNVDLRPSPKAFPYIKELEISAVKGRKIEGIFYGQRITNGVLNRSWPRPYIAFHTSDLSNEYYHVAYLQDGQLRGVTYGIGRDFVAPWTAKKKNK